MTRKAVADVAVFAIRAEQRIIGKDARPAAITNASGEAIVGENGGAIALHKSGFIPKRLILEGEARYEVLLDEGQRLDVRLVDFAGEPISGATCQISRGMLPITPVDMNSKYSKIPMPPELNPVVFDSTDANGHVLFTGLNDGDYFIDITHARYLWIPERGFPMPPRITIPGGTSEFRAATLLGVAVRVEKNVFMPRLKISSEHQITDEIGRFRTALLRKSFIGRFGPDVLVDVVAVTDEGLTASGKVEFLTSDGVQQSCELKVQTLDKIVVQDIPENFSLNTPAGSVRLLLQSETGHAIEDADLEVRVNRVPIDRKNPWSKPTRVPALLDLPNGDYAVVPVGDVHSSIFGKADFSVKQGTHTEVILRAKMPIRRVDVDLTGVGSEFLRPLESVSVRLTNISNNDIQIIECAVGGKSRASWVPVRTRFESSFIVPGIHRFTYEIDIDGGSDNILLKTGLE